MNRYKYYQPNEKDKKDKYGDCVYRALTKVLNKTWLEVFDDINKLAREMQCPANFKTCFIKFLEQKGFVKYTLPRAKGTKRPTVDSFAKDNPKGTYFLKVSNHVVAVVDGYYYDTWDSGQKSVYRYWKKEEKKNDK